MNRLKAMTGALLVLILSALSGLFVPRAFAAANMNRIQAGTVTLWLYKSATDAIAAIAASGYFDNHASFLRQGDVIIAVDPGTSVDVLTVSSADNATPVTVVNGT